MNAKGNYEKINTPPSPGGGVSDDGATSPPDPLSHGERGSVSKKFELGYGYAANGNLTAKTIYNADTGAIDDQWNYSYANHAVTAITASRSSAGHTMRYDAAGNMITQIDHGRNMAKEMAYDSYNRIRQITDPHNGNVKGQYWYDDQGFRVRKKARVDHGGEEKDVETLSPSMYFTVEISRNAIGRVRKEKGYGVNNIYLNGVRVAAVMPGGEAQYYLTDQVDSVKVVTNDAGLVVTSHEYMPFGEDWITEGDTKNAPKYNSQELDKESGYYFYNARHYDPEIGRFVTADSIVPRENDTQSWSRYSYCSNSPVIYKDPTGHYEIKVEVSKNRDHAGTLTLYNDYGIKVASYTALARGSNAPENNYNHTNRLKQNADTPTGKYVVTDKIKIPDKNSSDYHTYGPNRLRLSGVEGEAKKAYDNGRSGINIHGGDQRTAPRPGTDKNESGRNLNYTYGCVRVSNEAISDLTSKVNKIEEGRKEGVTQYLYKARNYLYNIIGKDTRDVVNVTEKK